MDPVEFANRSNYARSLGIEFLGPNESYRWPATHQRLFEDAQKLGCQKHDSFIEMISIDSIEKPWRRTTISRAKRLSHLAQKCFDETRNEYGWRLAIENEIMYRFTVEVACPQCRNRLWESEIPAATDSFLKQADSLEDRRRKRKPCRCPNARGDNRYDGGINMLFSDRAEARINHSPALILSTQPLKLKHYEAPDRMFGLRQTDNLRFLLNSADKRYIETSNITLRESIEHSPFSAEREPLLFPFLMIEAKSSKGADRAEVQMQSAFCIRRLLKLQHDLVAATGEETEWATGPLIWFLGTRGEQWDLYAGFVDETDSGTVRYPIVDLWSGDIRREDGALQLLLLVDYIFDWARDIYRNAIINELNTLATGEITDNDPDIFSTISRRMSHISNWTSFSHGGDSPPASFIAEPQEQSFLNIVFPEGVIRDASIIESRFFLLQITEDDVDTFLLSFSSAQDAQSWLQNVLKCLPNAWRVSSKTIHAMESVWTEKTRPPRENYRQEEAFYINFAIIMFMTENWEPIRQLTSLAISEGALKTLMAKTGCDMGLDLEGCPEVGELSIQSMLERILKQSILDNLTAAVSMLCMSSCCYKQDRAIPYHLQVKRSSEVSAGLRFDKSPHLIQLVHSVYLSHKIGQREPRDLYIYFSRLQSKQTIEYRGATIEMWPKLPRLVESEVGGILVDGILHQNDSPRRGLFLSGGLIHYESLSNLVYRVSRDGIYFKTLQIGPGLSFVNSFRHLNSPIRLKQEWKDKADPESFLRWRERLENMEGLRLGARSSSPMIISSDEE